ncbi:MAG TPA: hypothetical protein VF202_02190 [Trueperaceae bacterium]
MSRALIVFAGDLHVNGTLSLSPPGPFQLDDGGTYRPSKVQRWINAKWAEFWAHAASVKAAEGVEVVTVLTGELADINKHPSAQYVSVNPADVVGMALEVLQPVVSVSDRIYVTRGTEAHVGLSGSLDEGIASAIDAVPDEEGRFSRWIFRGVIAGLRVDAAHHPGTSYMRPWTRGADANRLAAMVTDVYVRGGQLPPDLVVRGHTHRPSDSFDNHPARAVILPSWKLTDAYGHRLGGAPLPIGGMQVLVEDGRIEREWKLFHDWPLGKWRDA